MPILLIILREVRASTQRKLSDGKSEQKEESARNSGGVFLPIVTAPEKNI